METHVHKAYKSSFRGEGMRCRSCGGEGCKPFLSLGSTPLANSLLTAEQRSQPEYTVPLASVVCPTCWLVQLTEVVDPALLFRNYLYVTSTTKTFRDHFGAFANHVVDEFKLPAGALAVDIGSNDGLLLRSFAQRGMTVRGVEPATNLAKLANESGVPTINEFFDQRVVDTIIGDVGTASVVTANNVFAHIEDIHGVTRNVKRLLAPDGVFVVEAQYLLDTIQMMTFDNTYHEHLYYYSLTALGAFFAMHDMRIFHVEHVDTHGGSIRVFVAHKDARHTRRQSVDDMLANEERLGVRNYSFYAGYAAKIADMRERLTRHIRSLKEQGKRIAGYGAPAKSTTLLNYCGIGSQYIDYVVEDNALKHGLFTPGTHIPIVPSSELESNTPDYVLVLAWNFAKEILGKTEALQKKGVGFIVPLPTPVVVENGVQKPL